MSEKTTIRITRDAHKLVEKRAKKRGTKIEFAAEEMIRFAHKNDKTK